MTPRDQLGHALVALQLARETGGVTVSRLAAECRIHRSSAHATLVRLVDAKELYRYGSVGRHGHVYHQQTIDKMVHVGAESGYVWGSLHQAVLEGRVFHRGHRVLRINVQCERVEWTHCGEWRMAGYNNTDDQLEIRD